MSPTAYKRKYGLPVLERIQQRVEIDAAGCWIWCGVMDRFGYGVIRMPRQADGKKPLRVVHRVAYEELVGPVPSGLFLDHLCRVTSCANPAHLEPVTAAENNRRKEKANPRTRCLRGHEFDDKNTRIRPNGKRTCRACERASNLRSRARKADQ